MSLLPWALFLHLWVSGDLVHAEQRSSCSGQCTSLCQIKPQLELERVGLPPPPSPLPHPLPPLGPSTPQRRQEVPQPRNVLLLTQNVRPGHPRRPGHRPMSAALGEGVGRGLWGVCATLRPRAGRHGGRSARRGCSQRPHASCCASSRRPEARKIPTAPVRVSDGVLVFQTLYSRPRSDHGGSNNLNWLVKKKNLGRNRL